MVIRGNARGNGRQLSHYLLTMKDNEAIRILDVNGQMNPQAEDLHRNIFLMGVSSELSKSEKGLYHAQINPAIGEDAAMDDKAWLEAGDILGRQLGLTNQRRAIVLHTKKGRTHAHVVWERFDHEKQKMVSDSFSRLAQDRARKEMELVFNHQKTPHRNVHRPELKTSLTQLWNQTGTGAQFVKAARENDYLIAEGSGRSPYVVVDEAGRSFNLARQLQGVKLKDIRHRLRNESLLGEKDAITKARNNAGNTDKQKDGGKQQSSSHTLKYKTMQEFNDNREDATGQNERKQEAAKGQFNENKADMGVDKEGQAKQSKEEKLQDNKQDITGQQTEQSVKDKFKENMKDPGLDEKEKEKERKREEVRKRFSDMDSQKQRNKDKGMDMG